MVEGVLPLGKRLETIHRTPIKTIGHGSEKQEDNPCVEHDDPRIKNGESAGVEVESEKGGQSTSCCCARSCSDRASGRSPQKHRR